MKYIILFLFILSFITCSKNEITCTDCLDVVLKEYKMVRYHGQENWCSSLTLFEYEDKQYFVYDNCLADMYFNPIDCNLKQLCITNGLYDLNKCELFIAESKNLGIVGINP